MPSRKPLKRKPWKKASDVKKLLFTKDAKGHPVKLALGGFGTIYLGRIWFGKKPNRVAIKVFKVPLSDAKAKRYQRVIDDLVKAGVRLPKMGMLKIPTERIPKGEWVQGTWLYGSTKKGSKLVLKSLFNISTEKGREEAIRELTKVANAGYSPVGDLIEPFKDQLGGRHAVLPIDLDLIVLGRKVPVKKRAQRIVSSINFLFGTTGLIHIKEKEKLLNIAIKEASSTQLKQALESLRGRLKQSI
jgi:hypothetical protein